MWYKLMGDSLIIYSSVFLLVSFVVLNKYLMKDVLKSLAIPVLLLISYFVLVGGSEGGVSGVVDNGMELLTEMPNF
jgi:hypothetical protein